MQIAALVFTKQDFLLIRWISSPELLDAGLLFTLATNGFVPTVLTLSRTMQYGRQSWYLIFLCSIVFVLSTGTLAASSNAWYAAGFDPRYGVLDVCGDFVASDLATAWCGSNNLFSISGYNPTTINKVIWVMWAHSLLWLVYCFSKKIRTSDRFLPRASKLGSLCQPRFQLSARLPMGAWGEPIEQGTVLPHMVAVTRLSTLAVRRHPARINHQPHLELWADLGTRHLGALPRRIPEVGIQRVIFSHFHPIRILMEFFSDGVFKGSEYKLPPSLALATLGLAEFLHRDESTSRIIPLADMSTRRADVGDESGSETAGREMRPEERI